MGSSESLDNTALGKSLINQRFRTKVPFGLFYTDKWYMCVDNCSTRISQKFIMIITEPITFTILETIQHWTTNMGYYIDIVTEVNNLIPLDNTSLDSTNNLIEMNACGDHLQIDSKVVIRINSDKLPTGFYIKRLLKNGYDTSNPVNIDYNILESL